MKKVFALLLASAMLLALASCGDTETATSSEAASVASIPALVSSEEEASSSIVVPPSIPDPLPVEVNIALDATAFCDENANHVDGYEYAAALVNDNDTATAWQKTGSINAGDGGTWEAAVLYPDSEVFIGLEWSEAHNIDTLVVVNDPGNAMIPFEDGGYKVEYFDGENWVEVTNLVDTREEIGQYEIHISFDAVNTTKIVITLFKGAEGGKNAPKIYEIMVYEAKTAVESAIEAEA